LIEGLQEREKQRQQAHQALAEVDGMEQVAQLDAPRVAHEVASRLTDWQGLLHRHPAQARQILRKLLSGRLITGEGRRGSVLQLCRRRSARALAYGCGRHGP
jgi:hypothetical protein